jgi:uncharacterized protein with PQ loop repeat
VTRPKFTNGPTVLHTTLAPLNALTSASTLCSLSMISQVADSRRTTRCAIISCTRFALRATAVKGICWSISQSMISMPV